MPSLLTLSDVLGTGRHAAEQVIILGRHRGRTGLARELGRTGAVAERGEEADERVRELAGGLGVHGVLIVLWYVVTRAGAGGASAWRGRRAEGRWSSGRSNT